MNSQAPKYFFILLVSSYFILLTFSIGLFLPGGRSDEAESLLLSQDFLWGYILRNPPLFDWLVYLTAKLFGPNVDIVVLYKMLSQWLMVVSTYLAALKLSKDQTTSIATALGTLTFFQFHWYALTDLTHTLLSGAFFPLTLLVLINLKNDLSRRNYFILGIVIALGLLTKYTYFLFLICLILAALANKDYRRLLLDKRIAIAFTTAFLIVLPHFFWVSKHLDQVDQQLIYSLETSRHANYWDGMIAGMASFAQNLVSVVFVPALLLLVSARFDKTSKQSGELNNRQDLQYLRNSLALMTLAIAVTVLLGAQEVKYHHLFYLTLLPLWLIPELAAAGRIKTHWLIRFQVAYMLFVLIAFPLTQLSKSKSCKACGAYLPYEQLAAFIQQSGFSEGTVIYFNRHRQFNVPILRQYFGDSRFVSTREFMYRPPERRRPGDCLILWDEQHQGELKEILSGKVLLDDIGSSINPAQAESWTYRFDIPTKQPYRVFGALIPEGIGTCH